MSKPPFDVQCTKSKVVLVNVLIIGPTFKSFYSNNVSHNKFHTDNPITICFKFLL